MAHIIAKPFDADTLLLTVQQGLERRRLVQEMKRLAQVEAEKQSLERRKAELEELDEEFYRGKVDVQSTVGEGSAFTVALPIDTEKPSLASSAPEQEEEGEGGR